MLALTTTGDDELLRITEVPDPEPGAAEALVRVQATSLNRGEVSRTKHSPAGQRVGWDVSGIVERAAAGGIGPAAGTRVLGLVNNGAWAELAAVPVDYLAAAPDGVTLAQAACMPLAGMTAFRALAIGGFPVGKSVFITGASGGVGHLAVQLARAAQMTVTGLIRNPEANAAAGTRMAAAQMPTPTQFRRDNQKTAEKYLGLGAQAARKAGMPCATLCVTDNQPYTAIVKIAHSKKNDLIVMRASSRKPLSLRLLIFH